MSKFSESLRAHKIYNVHGLLERFGGKEGVAVCYRPSERIRAAKSYVYSPAHKTNPDSAWYDGGNKSFVGKKSFSRPKAAQWATETYGITEWVPYDGDLIPKIVMMRVKKFLKETAIRAELTSEAATK